MSTIDYKALAARANECLQQWEALEAWDISIEPWSFLEVLRTVVSLLEGMADMEPAARIYTDAELVHRDPRWGRVCWIVPECEIDGGALLYLHPAPQPQPERQPVSEPRSCTCHPDDNPPIPCAQKYALSECRPEPTDAQIEARDALLDFISENGTASEGVQHYLDLYVRAALAAKENNDAAQLVPGDGVNRIAELRALRQTERSAHGGDDLMPWANAADALRGALYDDCDALLDCAKALRGLVDVAKDSLGIAGYHLNGEILEWDDVEELHAGMDALRRLSAGVSRSFR